MCEFNYFQKGNVQFDDKRDGDPHEAAVSRTHSVLLPGPILHLYGVSGCAMKALVIIVN